MTNIDKTVTVGQYSIIDEDVTLEANVRIGRYCEIRKGCHVGKYTTFGSRCTLASNTVIGNYCNLKYGLVTTDDYSMNLKDRHPPRIWDKVRTGANVTIMPNVDLGENCIIGAGSVVFRSVPAYEVWAGTPAKKIRDIYGSEIIL